MSFFFIRSLLLIAATCSSLYSFAQYQKQDIKKITFLSSGGWWIPENNIYLELFPDGSLQMTNSNYDSVNVLDIISNGKWSEGVPVSLELKKEDIINIADKYLPYYTGYIGGQDYNNLAQKIIQHQTDTTKALLYEFLCGTDFPYAEVKVYFKDGKRHRYKYCFTKEEKAFILYELLFDIAYKRGYKRSEKKIRFDIND